MPYVVFIFFVKWRIDMDVDSVIHAAAEAGRIILENGGETYRVEDTILRICNAFNIKDADSYVTPTGIILSAADEYEQTVSLVVRIKCRTVNLEKIALVNDVSRNIKTKGYTLEQLRDELKKIDTMKKYKNSTLIISSGFGSGFFAFLFGGNLYDFAVSFAAGCIIKQLSIILSKININDFFIYIVGGMTAALSALISVQIFPFSCHLDKIIIGSIMILVPGLAITNAIRDTISGDLVSGISRAAEAFLIAVAVAAGTGIVLKFWFTFSGGAIH